MLELTLVSLTPDDPDAHICWPCTHCMPWVLEIVDID